MLGLIEDIDHHSTIGFKHEGDLVAMLGGDGKGTDGKGGSEYLKLIHDIVVGALSIDLDLEKRAQRCCLDAIRQGIIRSAHDCSDGGLAVTLAESCIAGGIGIKGKWKIAGRIDSELFGEGQSRIVVSLEPVRLGELRNLAARHRVPLKELGVAGGDHFLIKDVVDLPLAEVTGAWKSGLEKAMG
jgi:phosphoribosylformylglycinamidine synthase